MCGGREVGKRKRRARTEGRGGKMRKKRWRKRKMKKSIRNTKVFLLYLKDIVSSLDEMVKKQKMKPKKTLKRRRRWVVLKFNTHKCT